MKKELRVLKSKVEEWELPEISLDVKNDRNVFSINF